ncbi:MAG: plasmid pRiA4b ORF-3 family protein [Planctomycetota bacterium]
MDAFQIKVTLRDVRPPLWRRFVVPAAISLKSLHDVVQIAMGWLDCHLYSFESGGRRFIDPERMDDPWGEWSDVRETTLASLGPKAGSRIKYSYDFGDGWEHDLLVESVVQRGEVDALPVCVKGRRECPPEDCGGPFGYAQLLAGMEDPDGADPELLEWIPDDFDPAAFDLDEVNCALRVEFPATGGGVLPFLDPQ